MNQSLLHIIIYIIILLADMVGSPASAAVNFTVRNAENGAPLEFAAIALNPLESGKFTGGNTDAEGKFSVTISDSCRLQTISSNIVFDRWDLPHNQSSIK